MAKAGEPGPIVLYRPIELADAAPADPLSRWLSPAITAAALASAAIIAWAFNLAAPALILLIAAAVVPPAVMWLQRDKSPAIAESTDQQEFDPALVGAALAVSSEPALLTASDGSLLLANPEFRRRFGDVRQIGDIAAQLDDQAAIGEALDEAWRGGRAGPCNAVTKAGPVTLEARRSGERVVWHFTRIQPEALLMASAGIAGMEGEQLAAADILAAALDGDGRILAANRLFRERALGGDGNGAELPSLEQILAPAGDGLVRLVAEGDDAPPLRTVELFPDGGEAGSSGLTLLLVEQAVRSNVSTSNVQELLEILPIGLALVDRDGRFLTMNKAFRAAGGIGDSHPVYPGDLVVKEDKAAVADAVRRNARGPAMSGDLAVRLAHLPTEPVALTIAGLRGLGDAAVLLLLKDNSEEAKLKRQVAQAIKMQMVGQLAGGVAHDFNNILTAIIGHCDLMLMRHGPGDSDYDDIQQIKGNSNRAAGLTRQLLAFSRQQTLRPQVLQLPDVISEVSHLLKRLLGETVSLVVKHGRGLGSVRADPGQLEQVIINLAVNARDAMAPSGGGTLTIQTYPVRAGQVAELGSEILPIADYTALSITDTGTGIPPSVLGKIFEPFFTTKEVGKGTGLGLSTVYGIVKQSGGFIFADSKVGKGTQFVIYLPVHEDDKSESRKKVAPPAKAELWGSGTVLLVEDEPMVRLVAERALTRHGYKVITAENGEDALEVIARGEEIALLISDVVMPAMDGPTMVREARKSRPELPILFMSGYAEEQLRKSIDIANVAFLPKPFSVQELAEAARKALSAK